MEVDSDVASQLHSQLATDLEISDDSASDEEEDAFNWGWEAVSFVIEENRNFHSLIFNIHDIF